MEFFFYPFLGMRPGTIKNVLGAQRRCKAEDK